MRWTDDPALQATQAALCASHSLAQHAKQACIKALFGNNSAGEPVLGQTANPASVLLLLQIIVGMQVV